MNSRFAGWESILVVLMVALGAGLWYDHTHPRVEVVENPVPTVKVVQVEGPVTTKVITQTITDPTQAKLIEQLVAENKKLKESVTTLTSTVATLQTQGGTSNGGVVTPVPVSTGPMEFKFTDFHLNATYLSDGSKFDYQYGQSLRVVTSTGKQADGSKLSIVEVFSDEPGGLRKIPATTTELQLPDNPPHFTFSPRVQGGIGWATDGRSGLVALQWLRRGTSPAAEDTKWSLLSPAIGTNGLTLLPVSINLGQIKHNPLTNLWVSPTVNSKAIGVAITATF